MTPIANGSLASRVALVTGSTQNLGRAAADAFAAEGATVVIVSGSSQGKADGVADELRSTHGVEALGVVAQIADPAQVKAAVDTVLEKLGRIDIIVEAAALRPHSPLLEITPEEWDEVIATNLTSAFHFARAVVPGMRERKWGRIIHVSGSDGFTGYPNRAHNVTAKAGIHGFTKAVALETARDGITVNSIVPGAFLTVRDPAKYPGWTNEAFAETIPVGRLGDVEEFGAMCLHLCSDKSAFITGQALHMNGGQCMV